MSLLFGGVCAASASGSLDSTCPMAAQAQVFRLATKFSRCHVSNPPKIQMG